MSETPQSSNPATLVFFGVGLLSALFGILLIVERLTFASLFFGTDLDELKVTFVECGGIFVITQGVVLL